MALPERRPEDHDETARGIVDPRNIHPSPEGLFPDGDSDGAEPSPKPSSDPSPQDDVARGIVDPRREAAGPDL